MNLFGDQNFRGLIFIARTKDETILTIRISRSTVSTTVEQKSHEQQSQNKHHYQ